MKQQADKPNIVVLDGYTVNPGDLSWRGLETLGACTVYDRTAADEVVPRCKEADIVLTNKVPLDAAALLHLPRLRYVGVLATGYNVVDLEAASRQGIVVTNIPAYSTASVAQMVFAHLLNIVNRTQLHSDSVRSGAWSHCADFSYMLSPQTELAGKTMGVVGMGHIGSMVAAVAHAFGMKVVAQTSKAQSELPEYVTPLPFEALLQVSDVVSLHCPLTEATRCLINATTLALMKPDAILINTGRGGLMDEQAVAEALMSGRLRAVGVDVLSTEPPSEHNPLLAAPHCYITPHIAWATYEARVRLMRIATENVSAYMSGVPVNQVN